MVKILIYFHTVEHRGLHIADVQSDGPYRPQTLVSDNLTSEDDVGYCRFIPPSAVDTAPDPTSPTSSDSSSSSTSREQEGEEDPLYYYPKDGSSSVSSRDQEDDDPVYDYPRDWTLPEVLVTLPSGKFINQLHEALLYL